MLSQGNTELTLNRRGRKRKQGVVRDSSGKSRGETVDAVIGTVIRQPHRRWYSAPRDARLAYPLGRLLLTDNITKRQHDAGRWWASVVRRYAIDKGIPLPHPKGAEFARMIARDPSDIGYQWSDTMDEQDIEELREKTAKHYDECNGALYEAGRQIYTGNGYGVKHGNAVAVICKRICILEEDETILFPHHLGNLRVGLNALAGVRR